MKRAVAVEPDKAATPTAVRRLLSEISTEDLEPLAVEIIREHQRRLQRAEDLFNALDGGEQISSTLEVRQVRHKYRMAMLNLHAHHQLVSLVIAALGYVPEVDGQSPDDSSPH